MQPNVSVVPEAPTGTGRQEEVRHQHWRRHKAPCSPVRGRGHITAPQASLRSDTPTSARTARAKASHVSLPKASWGSPPEPGCQTRLRGADRSAGSCWLWRGSCQGVRGSGHLAGPEDGAPADQWPAGKWGPPCGSCKALNSVRKHVSRERSLPRASAGTVSLVAWEILSREPGR